MNTCISILCHFIQIYAKLFNPTTLCLGLLPIKNIFSLCAVFNFKYSVSKQVAFQFGYYGFQRVTHQVVSEACVDLFGDLLHGQLFVSHPLAVKLNTKQPGGNARSVEVGHFIVHVNEFLKC